MSALSIRGLVMGAALLGTSIAAVNVEAMGCRQGGYATAPMGPPAAMGMMPYGMPGGYGYAPPVMYGYGDHFFAANVSAGFDEWDVFEHGAARLAFRKAHNQAMDRTV